MSHFTVLVIGENPEEQLKPFDENLRVEFKDKTEEYRKEYETYKTTTFYCDSSSSWGHQITQELFETLKASKVGRIATYDVPKLNGMSYVKTGGKYRGYYSLEDGKRCKGDQWFEVINILETTHPNPDTCFEGKIQIRKIARPRSILLKDKYPIYEDYLKSWQGNENPERQGYDYNPQAKWDWHQLGGRWGGFFTLKPGSKGTLGKVSWTREEDPPKPGTADQTYKGDIDFDKMREDNFEEASKTYDEYEEKYKSGEMNRGEGYFHYGIENTGDRDNYIPETREQYLKRQVAVSTFAVLKDGKWYEKGEMGWWGIVSDEKDPDEWHDQFNKLIEELPDDTLLSLYDCHI